MEYIYHLFMGNTTSIRKVNFEDVQYSIKQKQNYLLINTLDSSEQSCLITNTIPVNSEEKIINEYLNKKININIIVYDKNANAPNLMKKYEIPEGKQLGKKLRTIEEEWVKNNFKISDQQVDNIINN